MSKCIKCGNLFINNPQDDEVCHICKIADLEAKLAEKEEEIETLNRVAENNKIVAMLVAREKSKFAIAELEKVKEWANDYYGECSAIVITHFIDNQIEELKKEMK